VEQPASRGAGDDVRGPELSTVHRDALLLLDAADHLYSAAVLLEEACRRLRG
jgi:hypothetical protein